MDATLGNPHEVTRDSLTESRRRCFLVENKIAGKKSSATEAGALTEREGKVADIEQRIAAMHKSDVRIAWGFVVGLWCAIIFVAFATWNLAPDSAGRVLLLIGGAIILIFNTAAIMAMLRHYREDRDFMYGLDIKFLDAARAAKR